MIDTGSYSAQIVGLENENRQLLLQSRKAAGARSSSRRSGGGPGSGAIAIFG